MIYAVRWLFSIITCALLILATVSCKKSGDGFDLLQGGGGGSSNVDVLTIKEAIPDATNIVLEIGDVQEFFVSAQAPLGRNISYTWTLDNVVILQGTTIRYTVNATVGNIGNHVLKVVANDEKTTAEKSWNVKVNGPPVVNPVTTGIPKVSVGSSIMITAAVTDPNSDSISYTWLLNGLPSAQLIGTGATATLTGAVANVGPVSITVVADDGTATDSYSWNGEVNYFPMPCNTLAQGQICTYGGNPSVGNNENPLAPVYDIRIQPIGQTQDALGNIFIADYGNNVVWYWNRTASPVTRVGINVPANTFTVVAGSGELATTGDGLPALTAAINRPRAVWYNDMTDVLYIAEYSGNRVRYVDGSGTIFTGMGGSNSNTDAVAAFSHACASPSSFAVRGTDLYIACYGSHRVKRWDLLTDLAYTAYGNGTNSIAANGSAPVSAAANPYDLHMTADGLYVTHAAHHRIRFVNLSGVNKTFWAANPSAITVNANTVSTIIGTGTAGATASGNALAIDIGAPSGIAVIGDLIYFNIRQGSSDRFYVANNSAVGVTIGTQSIASKTVGRFSGTAQGYNGSGINLNVATSNEPYDIQVDILDPDILIFSDYGNNRLRQIDLGAVRMYDTIGTGNLRADHYGDPLFPTYQHYFNNTNGIDYEENSRTVFFVDQNNNRIRSVNAYGETQTVLGIGYGAPVADNEPATSALMAATLTGSVNQQNGLHVLPDGSIAHVNSRVHNVRIWNRTNAAQTYAGAYIMAGRVSNVAGDHVTGAGNGPDGPALSSLVNVPTDVVSYVNGGNLEIFISDQNNHCIKMLDHNGDLNAVLGQCGAAAGDAGNNVAAGSVQFNRPHGLAVDSLGNLIIADTYNNKIRYWNRTGSTVNVAGLSVVAGNVITIACNNGTTGSSTENVLATTSRCSNPMGVDVNANSICFAQFGRHNVRCINVSDGRINTVAGRAENNPRAGSPVGFEQEGVAGTNATLYNPVDVVFDDNGDLFISDRTNHIIRKLKLTP